MATTTIENHRRCAAATLPRCQGVFIYWLAFGEWVWTPIALVGGPKRIIDHTGDKMYAIGDRFLMSPDDGRTWKPMSFPTSIPGYGPGGIQVSISGTGSRIPVGLGTTGDRMVLASSMWSCWEVGLIESS
jgi:hypothetical protein